MPLLNITSIGFSILTSQWRENLNHKVDFHFKNWSIIYFKNCFTNLGKEFWSYSFFSNWMKLKNFCSKDWKFFFFFFLFFCAKTHFRNFFRARWCASRPSERDLRVLASTWLRLLPLPPPPYQRTQTVKLPGAPKDSTFPGQAVLPRAAPQTTSPTSSFHGFAASPSSLEGTESPRNNISMFYTMKNFKFFNIIPFYFTLNSNLYQHKAQN